MSVYDRLKEIEREGYKAALNGESRRKPLSADVFGEAA